MHDDDFDDMPSELEILETYADMGWPPAVAELAKRRAAGEKVQPAGLVEALVSGGFI
jgi:hypothetical protein